jgi:hypothetical protein
MGIAFAPPVLRLRSALLAPLALVATVAAACNPAQVPDAPTVSLRMTGSPKDATVTIDDISVGTLDTVSARGVALPPGRHRITVEAPGYFPSDTLVDAQESAAESKTPLRLHVALLAVPD